MSEEENRAPGVSRREFLKDAGLLVGGATVGSMGLLNACGTTKTQTVTQTASVIITKQAETSTVPAIALPVNVPLSKGVLIVDEELCGRCMNCVLTCALYKDGVPSPELGRIQLNAYSHSIFDVAAKPCLQCVDPQCLRYCPVGAIKVDPTTGARVIDQQFCIGCQTCIQSCPFTPPRVVYDKVKHKALKCDLCGGDPQCVKSCPIGALTYYKDPNGVRTGYVDPRGGL